MTKYDQLRSAFAGYTDRTREYTRENEAFAKAVVYGFAEYAGIPKSYNHYNVDVIEKRTYLPVYSIGEFDETVPEKFIENAITHGSDGSFSFGFGVTLERAEGTFPKHIAIFTVKCRRTKALVHVDLGTKSVECPFDGTGAPEVAKVHDAIFDLLSDWMSWELGDGRGAPKFGFQVQS